MSKSARKCALGAIHLNTLMESNKEMTLKVQGTISYETHSVDDSTTCDMQTVLDMRDDTSTLGHLQQVLKVIITGGAPY